MDFWNLVGEGLGWLYTLGILGIVTVFVAQTSRRVLGIRVAWVRALLVTFVVMVAVMAVIAVVVGPPDIGPGSSLSTVVAFCLSVLYMVLGTFALGVLGLMVLEIVLPSGSMPPLRTWFTGWRRRFHRLRRYLRIMLILARYGLTAPLRGVGRPERAQVTAESIRRAMEDAGVTFIKLGQMLSTRSDLLPAPFIKELSKLTTQVGPTEYRAIESVLRRELGDRLDRLDVDPAPLASASVAQVHAAVLDGTDDVVVKVRRDGAAEQVTIDLQILERLARTLAANAEWARNLGVVELVRGFADSLREELDYCVEVENMGALRASLGTSGVRIPQVYDALCTDQVIVMERFYGTPVAEGDELIATLPADVRRRSADVLLSAVVGQILEQGVFHADLHSGNVLVWPDGAVGLLDFGSVGRLDASSRHYLGLLLWAVNADDPALATDAVLEVLDHDGQVDERALQRGMGLLITRVRSSTTGGSLAFFQQLMALVMKQGMSVPTNIATALRSLGSLEGTLKLLYPPVDLIESAMQMSQDVIGDMSVEGAKHRITNQAMRLVPLVEHLPRRLNRITEDIETGRLTVHMRVVSHPDDRAFLTGLVQQVVVALLAGFAVIAGIMLATSSGGPTLFGARVFDLLGYLLGFAGFILSLRAVAMVFGRRG
ncbi:AarF/UbiB family protein [Brooklawnia cerclae]|uniref:Ubiquinone biosynthesis protein n=1 Tax=Brooklawnia cerclae TaxID=349934 RepID=A0ABX0SGF2_9ACTN|nr:ubiquinone biosynthesis protein [Brooklawnia cerclae]